MLFHMKLRIDKLIIETDEEGGVVWKVLVVMGVLALLCLVLYRVGIFAAVTALA